MKVLIIEDKILLTDAINEYLTNKKILVKVCNNGLKGYEEALNNIYDVIVLDIMLPGKNGLDILKDLRSNNINTPILMLSALSEVSDKVKGLTLGADDYLAKPFAMDELLARLKVLTRRKGEILDNELKVGDLTLNKDTHELHKDSETILLGYKEYEIFSLLMEKYPNQINKDYLLDKVLGYDNDSLYNSVEVYISFLRRKLKALKSNVSIKSIRSLGYLLEVEK
ncbi:MAG: response regulator transcription factor [Bacilli bacterium]